MRGRWWLSLVIVLGLVVACSSSGSTGDSTLIVISATPRPTITPTFPPPRPSPIGTPTATPCPGNPDWTDTYEVQAGDTLGQIAYLSGLSVDELRFANCLSNQDFVFVGQILTVPNSFRLTLATNAEGAAGIIVFVSASENTSDLYAVRSNGTEPRQLTDELLIYGRPVRSSDFIRVVFRVVSAFHIPETGMLEDAILPTDIYTVGVDGLELYQVADQGPRDFIYRSEPIWSPSNEFIAYTEQRGVVGALVVIDRDGQNRRVVLTENMTPPGALEPIPPAWSPNGEQIAAVIFDDGGQAQLILTNDRARAGIQEVLVQDFEYAGGPYWVPFDGVNGRPAIAIAALEGDTVSPLWRVIDPETGISEDRPGGLRLVNRTLEWWVEPRADGLRITREGTQLIDTLAIPISAISFAENEAALALGQGEGALLYFGLDEAVRQRIFSGSAIFPAWTQDRWIVLP